MAPSFNECTTSIIHVRRGEIFVYQRLYSQIENSNFHGNKSDEIYALLWRKNRNQREVSHFSQAQNKSLPYQVDVVYKTLNKHFVGVRKFINLSNTTKKFNLCVIEGQESRFLCFHDSSRR